jgi:hypothetical protein
MGVRVVEKSGDHPAIATGEVLPTSSGSERLSLVKVIDVGSATCIPPQSAYNGIALNRFSHMMSDFVGKGLHFLHQVFSPVHPSPHQKHF